MQDWDQPPSDHPQTETIFLHMSRVKGKNKIISLVIRMRKQFYFTVLEKKKAANGAVSSRLPCVCINAIMRENFATCQTCIWVPLIMTW